MLSLMQIQEELQRVRTLNGNSEFWFAYQSRYYCWSESRSEEVIEEPYINIDGPVNLEQAKALAALLTRIKEEGAEDCGY